jgi:hypothetical protein
MHGEYHYSGGFWLFQIDRSLEEVHQTLRTARTNGSPQYCGQGRIAVGPQQGRKVFTLQTLPDERDADDAPAAGKVAGFSLHAGVAAKACQRDKLERLCRYVTRPAIAEKRLSLTKQGKVRYELKTPYRRQAGRPGTQAQGQPDPIG